MSSLHTPAPLTGPTGPRWIFGLAFGIPAFAVAAVAVVLNWGR